MKRPRLVLGLLLAAALLAMLILQQPATRYIRLERTPALAAVFNDPATPTLERPAADVTLVLFTDYQCAVCKASNAALQKVLADDREIRVMYKDWPILGEVSMVAATAAIASGEQGGYPAFHDALMRAPGPLDEAGIYAAADRAGLDVNRLRAEMAADRDRIEALIARNRVQAWSLGLEGTPAFLAGPFLVRGGVDEGTLRSLIAAARTERGTDRSS